MGMNTSELLSSIDVEIARLKEVRALLSGRASYVRRGRKTGTVRAISADGRARIAEAQRKRWAKQKRVAKK
jgi:hypothetical protein